ncbi:Adenine phosphoribosyltransferase [Liparis tanakae]|uniref:Adenine phosphoribosyltransferase n=1 Tax=Liparis tanakae TaxID=230148 RepID=A0A4Z2HEG1_9TELE|nr:Adenine phosphoribosyltransferase [Liparis tanakae]
MSSSSFLSPPPSPHTAPLPLSSSSLICCPELDLSVTLGSAPKTSHAHFKPSSLKTGQQRDPSQLKPLPQGPRGRGSNTRVFFQEPVDVTVTPQQNRDAPPKQPIRAPRQWLESRGAVSNQGPGCLERVGLNTTLALKAELQLLQGAEFNSQKAMQETLRRSERTKNLINTRATEEVNVSRSQVLFNSLVCVDVQEDQLISQMLQHRLQPSCHSNKVADGPSLLLFMNSDHLRQKPFPLEEEPVNYKPRPLTDICPILKDPAALTAVTDLFEEHIRKNHPQVELIVGLDARGFLFGPLLAQRLGVGFVLIRKKGKLPGTTVSVAYDLEYGKAEAEIQEDAVAPGQKILLIDDLLATGGTLYAACELMKKQQADILGCLVVIELKELNGIDKLKSHPVFSLVQY